MLEDRNEIERLRSERIQSRTRMLEITKRIEDMMITFNSDSGPTMVSWEQLASTEIGVEMHVNDKVYFIRQHSEPNELIFITYVEPGGTFGLQVHDCYEYCKVLKGHLKEMRRGGKIYLEGETAFYNINEVHRPGSEIKSVYQVTFTRDVNLTP